MDPAAELPGPPPPVPSGADKEARGRVVVVGGSRQTPGAVLLAGTAALRAGAGKVQLVVPGEIAVALGIALPEARVVTADDAPDLVGAADAVLFGPGLVDEAAARPWLDTVANAREHTPVVVDAGALALAADVHRPLVLTPNADERERAGMPGDAVFVGKGPRTSVTHGRRAWVHEDDLPGLAMSGSGDVLAGVIAGLLARGCDRFVAACWSVTTHAAAARAAAARRATVGYLASEVADEVPAALEATMASRAPLDVVELQDNPPKRPS